MGARRSECCQLPSRENPLFYTATGDKTYTGEYATEVITDRALDFLNRHRAEDRDPLSIAPPRTSSGWAGRRRPTGTPAGSGGAAPA